MRADEGVTSSVGELCSERGVGVEMVNDWKYGVRVSLISKPVS